MTKLYRGLNLNQLLQISTMNFDNNTLNLAGHFLDINTEVGSLFEVDPDLVRTMDQSIGRVVNEAGKAVSGNSQLSMTTNIQAGLTGEEKKYIAATSQGNSNTSSRSGGKRSSSNNETGRSSNPQTTDDQRSPKRRKISSVEQAELEDLDQILRSFTQKPVVGSSSMHVEQHSGASPSGAGSSSMHSQHTVHHSLPNSSSCCIHAQPVLDHSTQKQINEAVECFYRVTYKWFDMVPNFRRRRGEIRQQACRALDSNGSDNSSRWLSRTDIGRELQNELRDGNQLTQEFMESWARTLLWSNSFKFLCPSCDGLFRCSDLFESHLIKVPSGKIKCPYSCGKDLTRFDSIAAHLKLVHKINRSKHAENGAFQCDERGCGMTFETAAGLRTHKGMLHYRQERRCRMCKKDFPNKDIMAAHLLTVHGLKDGEPLPYACDVHGCESRFASQKGVEKHKALTHKIYSSSPRSRFRCTVKLCGRGFATAEGLRNHLKKKHGQ